MSVFSHKLIPGLLAVVMFLTTAVCPCALGFGSFAGQVAKSCCQRSHDGGKAPAQNRGDCNDCGYSRVLDSAKVASVNASPTHLAVFAHVPVLVIAPSFMPVQRGDAWSLDPCVESGTSLLRLHCALLV